MATSPLVADRYPVKRFSVVDFPAPLGPKKPRISPFLTVKEQFYLVDKVSRKAKEKERIDELLASLDILDLQDKFPRDLSGGERQRVAIGRALFNDPSLILADEPTASLDTDHAYEVVKLLVKEAHEKKKATVMVTHDERMIQWSDRIFRMEDGNLIEQNAPSRETAQVWVEK